MTTTPQNLEQLLAAILAGAYSDQDMTNLPTFGGQPVEKVGVFSWDARRVLKQGHGGWCIIPREGL